MRDAMWFLAQYLKERHPGLYARVRSMPPEVRERFWPLLCEEIALCVERAADVADREDTK